MTRRQVLLGFAAQQSRPDAQLILDQSVTLDETNLERLRSYVWNSEETSYLRGKQTSQQSYEINLVSGGMYWRRTAVDGKTLRGKELEAEQKRLASHLANPGPGYNWRQEREYLEILPLVHRATYLELTTLGGRPTHRIETKPIPGAASRFQRAFSYQLWIDQADLHWTRAEITVLQNTSWLYHQLAIGRISYPYSNNIVNSGQLKAGARTTIELQRLPDGVWTLARYHTQTAVYSNELRYFNYRRFSSESQLLSDPA